MKYALALSGGGANGAYHVGALEAFHEAGIKFDLVAGVSAGAFIGTQANNFEQLKLIWDELAGHPEAFFAPYFTDFDFKIKPWQIIKRLPGIINGRYKGIASSEPLQELIRRFVHADELPPEYYCGVVSLDSDNYYLLGFGIVTDIYELRKAILASGSMVPFIDPVSEIRIKNGLCITNAADGGLRNISPIKDVFKLKTSGEDWKIFSVNCRTGSTGSMEPRNLFEMIIKADQIKSAEIFSGDLYQDENIITIQPDKIRAIPPTWDFSFESMLSMRKRGYQDTISALKKTLP